jgi:hypothetical protein
MAEEDSIPMVPSHLIPGRDDMISMLAEMGMGHLVMAETATIAPEVRPVPGIRFPPQKVQITPGPLMKPAPGTPEKNPLPAARAPASACEPGAGIRGPAVFTDPTCPGEQYELSTANTIIFLRACDRAQKGLTPDEHVQFRHLWLKVYGNRV